MQVPDRAGRRGLRLPPGRLIPIPFMAGLGPAINVANSDERRGLSLRLLDAARGIKDANCSRSAVLKTTHTCCAVAPISNAITQYRLDHTALRNSRYDITLLD